MGLLEDQQSEVLALPYFSPRRDDKNDHMENEHRNRTHFLRRKLFVQSNREQAAMIPACGSWTNRMTNWDNI